MAKPNYSYLKRQKEIAKKQKKEEKRQQKIAEKQPAETEEGSPEPPVEKLSDV